MFKKFIIKEDVSSNTPLKSSAQRSIRAKLLEQFPVLGKDLSISSSTNSVFNVEEEDLDEEDEEDELLSEKVEEGGEKRDENDVDEVRLSLLETIWPKKETLYLIKCRDHVSILACNGIPLFFQRFDEPYFPTLRLIHQYPSLLPRLQVDRGAIKFVLSGANVMCPGLTSKGGRLPTKKNLEPKSIVSIYAEGKKNPCAIGLTTISTDQIRSVNKGIGIENIHWLGDDLWSIEKI